MLQAGSFFNQISDNGKDLSEYCVVVNADSAMEKPEDLQGKDVYRKHTEATRKTYDYLDYVASDDVLFLGAKKDGDSTSYATLYANGAYNF